MRAAAAVQALRPGALATGFAEALLAERERWALWLPVALGTGVGLYFLLPVEPPLWIGLCAVVAALAATAGLQGRAVGMAATVFVALSLGFALGEIRTRAVATPILDRSVGPVPVEGRVRELDHRDGSIRLTLDRLTIARLAPQRTPERARISLRGARTDIQIGARVRVNAILRPPPEPAAPGAFDFQRQAFFERLGATGFATGQLRVLRVDPPSGIIDGARLWIAEVRRKTTERLMAMLPGAAGAIAASLITGEQGPVPASDMQAVRDSGLAHLLSISGLHMSLVVGLVFFVVRGGLALIEPLALRWPTKKIAAVVALIVGFLYLQLSGASPPTQRSFLMVSIVLLAVLIDRQAISMRTIAWAAAAVLVIAPESLVGASFQMSFAAVVALIAVFEAMGDKLMAMRADSGVVRRALLHVAGLSLASIVATLATAPFTVFHFNRLPLYGLLANLTAIPVAELWVMPWGMMALLLMPFGLDGWALAPMGWGIEAILAIAKWTAALPGAVIVLPEMPIAALIAMTFGGLWLCLWQGSIRWLGLAGVAFGLLIAIAARPPDFLISADGKLIGARGEDGDMALSRRRAGFVPDTWLRRQGQDGGADWAQLWRCGASGCSRAYGPVEVALVRTPAERRVACAREGIVVVATIPARYCSAPRLVIDIIDLRADGTHALRFDGDRVEVLTVRGARGLRPWVAAAPGRGNRPRP
ncbi:MAG: ComEC family competence protein [Alphaproteobacteria bacterium]|nr:ComEC family competence protein [Alphaproteobacteria bacterium]